MKLIQMEFETEQERDQGVRAIIAIREKIPEPVLRTTETDKPKLMVWESEKTAFEEEMRRQGVPCLASRETEIAEFEFVHA